MVLPLGVLTLPKLSIHCRLRAHPCGQYYYRCLCYLTYLLALPLAYKSFSMSGQLCNGQTKKLGSTPVFSSMVVEKQIR